MDPETDAIRGPPRGERTYSSCNHRNSLRIGSPPQTFLRPLHSNPSKRTLSAIMCGRPLVGYLSLVANLGWPTLETESVHCQNRKRLVLQYRSLDTCIRRRSQYDPGSHSGRKKALSGVFIGTGKKKLSFRPKDCHCSRC